MNSKVWPTRRLGNVLQLQRRWVKPDPLEEYREIGVRSFGRGIFHKSPVLGAALGNKRVLKIRPGDLVFMNVFAWEGAVAVARKSEEGMIGSHRFATFMPIAEECIPEFLQYYFQTQSGRELLSSVSPGSAGRNRTMNLAMFQDQTVPLPPVEEQRRIVARIDRLAAKINEAVQLRQRSIEECNQLCRAILHDHRFGVSTLTPMRELVTWRKPDTEVSASETYDFAGVYCFGRGVFRGLRRTGTEFAYRQVTRIRSGEFIYPKLMAWEGALAVVPDECDGLVVSPEFSVFTVREDKVLPEVLDVYFRSPAVWPLLSGASTGTNVRRKRLNPNDFLKYDFPLPAREAQLALRSVRRKVIEFQSHSNQSAELNALLPSILDRAFKGEL